MKALADFLIRHGNLILFFWVFTEQLGFPAPATPILLAAGALAGTGRLSLSGSISLAMAGCLAADSFWFVVGRWQGARVLRWICRISIEPDSCVRRTENRYDKYGAKSLLIAKFVPGFNVVAAPLAGVFRMEALRFLVFDVCGIFFWAGSFIGLGYLFADQLEQIAQDSLQLGELLGILLLAFFAGSLAWKYLQRRKVFRDLRIARITPAELKDLLDAGERIQIVDLRSAFEFDAEPQTLPGALHFDPKEIEKHVPEIAPDRDVVLYCT